MNVFTRAELSIGTAALEGGLLLEGDWPAANCDARFAALDSALDCQHAWIDEAATQLAAEAAEAWLPDAALPNLAQINALRMRYYLVKLLRVVAYFQDVRRLNRHETVTVHLAREVDAAYADVLSALCDQAGARLELIWSADGVPTLDRSLRRAPANAAWRRWVGRVAQASPNKPEHSASTRRVLFCGNSRILDPVCEEVVRRGDRAAWLYDRFAPRAWWRWSHHGVRQFVCNSSEAAPHGSAHVELDRQIRFRGIDLRVPIERWLATMAAQEGASQQRLVEQAARHIKMFQPDWLVLSEDATPLARIAATAAREAGARSVVVQHGAPCIRFGFTPLLADYFAAWGETSRRQLGDWSVPDERIWVTGSPLEPAPAEPPRLKSLDRPVVLLLATVPPRTARPDALAFHLTTATHDAMLDAVHIAAGWLGARLIIKLHPRTNDVEAFRRAMARHKNVPVQLVQHGSANDLLRQAHCVVSCASSSGVEAASRGWPVVQLLPTGSQELLPAREWGLRGTARTADELHAQLAAALHSAHGTSAYDEAWHRTPDPAAKRIVDAMYDCETATSTAAPQEACV